MRISNIKKSISMIFKGRQPITPFVWGKPGIGKSQLFRQITKAMGPDFQFLDIRLSQVDSTDLRGIPHAVPEEGICKWLPPEFLPFKHIEKFKGTKGVLLLDEFNRARPDVLQSAFQLVLDRAVGLNEISDDWYICCAGNLGMEDRTDVVEMDSALKNRFIHFNADVNLDDWVNWAEEYSVHKDVVNFIRAHANHLYQTSAKEDENVFVTPRSWEKFSDILKNNPDVSPYLITETLGVNIINGSAAQFMKYLETKEVIPAADVLLKYDKVKGKIKSLSRDQVYSLNTEIASYIVENQDKLAGKASIEALHSYGKDFLEKDTYIAFLQDLTKKCLAVKKIDWINRYLREYVEEANEITDILKKK